MKRKRGKVTWGAEKGQVRGRSFLFPITPQKYTTHTVRQKAKGKMHKGKEKERERERKEKKEIEKFGRTKLEQC
jgi:hypothetical protein